MMDISSKYDIVMARRNGKFQAYVKELHLVGFGDSPDNAIAMIEQKYQELLSNLEDAGFSDDEMMRHQSTSTKSLNPAFLIKLASGVFSVLLIFFAANVMVNAAINKFEQTAYSLSKSVALRPLLVKLRTELVTLSERSPEQQREILNEVRHLVGILRPYVKEVAPLFGPIDSQDCPCNNKEISTVK